jgi:hypothetical protein
LKNFRALFFCTTSPATEEGAEAGRRSCPPGVNFVP